MKQPVIFLRSISRCSEHYILLAPSPPPPPTIDSPLFVSSFSSFKKILYAAQSEISIFRARFRLAPASSPPNFQLYTLSIANCSHKFAATAGKDAFQNIL